MSYASTVVRQFSRCWRRRGLRCLGHFGRRSRRGRCRRWRHRLDRRRLGQHLLWLRALGQRKGNADGMDQRHRASIDDRRLELPLAHRSQRGVVESAEGPHDAGVGHAPLPSDRDLDDDRALNAGVDRRLGVHGRDVPGPARFTDVPADTHGGGGRRLRASCAPTGLGTTRGVGRRHIRRGHRRSGRRRWHSLLRARLRATIVRWRWQRLPCGGARGWWRRRLGSRLG